MEKIKNVNNLTKEVKREIIEALDEMAKDSKEIRDFLEKLATKSTSFEDFIINISIWLEISNGSRQAFLDMILKASELRTAGVKVTKEELTKGDKAIPLYKQNAFSEKTKSTSKRTQIKMTLLKGVISGATTYQNYDFEKQTPITELFSISPKNVRTNQPSVPTVEEKQQPIATDNKGQQQPLKVVLYH